MAESVRTVHPRTDWTTTKARNDPLSWAKVTRVVVHWPGSSGTLAPAKAASLLRGWREYHTKNRGWRDIAYNEAVDQSGAVWILRGDVVDGATSGWGGRSFSILAILGSGEKPSEAMKAAIRSRSDRALTKAARGAKTVAHRDLVSTECPGDHLAAWVKAGMPIPTGSQPPKPPTARTVEVLLGVANCQSYDGSKTQQAWEARGWLMAREKRTVWVVTETTSAGRAVLQKMLGPSWKWKVWTLAGKSVGVLFDSSVWDWRKIRKTSVWTSFGHGTVAVPLVHKATGIGIDVLGHHTPPGSVASDATKDKRITQGAALAGGWPAIYAGDFARNTPKLPGWRRAGKAVDTMDKPGMQSVDDAYVRGLISIAEARVVDPGKWSDHKWRAYRLIVSAKPDTN